MNHFQTVEVGKGRLKQGECCCKTLPQTNETLSVNYGLTSFFLRHIKAFQYVSIKAHLEEEITEHWKERQDYSSLCVFICFKSVCC